MSEPSIVPKSRIDHLVITAPSLESGVEYVRGTLGVTMQAGGEHPRMGTHNRLLKLGERLFLEVIAVDPGAAPPARRRWFSLDQDGSNQVPRLATWVVRTDDIQAAVAVSPVAPGKIEPMRRGALDWFISIPEDGSMPLEGVAPTLIQWQVPTHPAQGLEDAGCSLVRLEGYHPQAESVNAMLAAVGFDGAFSATSLAADKRPHLVAHIRTPSGVIQLRG